MSIEYPLSLVSMLSSPLQYISVHHISIGEDILQKAINKLTSKFLKHDLTSVEYETVNTDLIFIWMIAARNHQTLLKAIFDDRLIIWKPHVTHIKSTRTSRINIIKMLSHSTFRADHSTLLKIYYALIKSKIDYGVPIYSSTSKSILSSLNVKSIIQQLDLESMPSQRREAGELTLLTYVTNVLFFFPSKMAIMDISNISNDQSF